MIFGTICIYMRHVNDFQVVNNYLSICWPRGLKHKLSSLAQTLGSCVRIPLKTWMSVCAFILCLCLMTGWSLVHGVLPLVWKRLRNLMIGVAQAMYVATSYRLDVPGCTPDSIFFVFFFAFSSVFFYIFVFLHILYVFKCIFCFLCFVMFVYVLHCTVDVHVLVLWKFVRCILLFSWDVLFPC
jgi:hypothetical protein